MHAPSIRPSKPGPTTILWAGQPITTISPNAPSASYLQFSFTSEQGIAAIAVDASQINDDLSYQNTYSRIAVDPSTCLISAQGNICTVPNLIIQTSNQAPTISITITTLDQAQTTLEQSYSFTIDSTSPEVIFLGTSGCVEQTCYLGNDISAEILIQMQDSIGTFHKQKVAYILGTQSHPVYSCDGLLCSGSAKTTCLDGNTVRLAIANYNGRPSQDDAGNPLVGIRQTDLICDATKPQIQKPFDFASSSGLPVISETNEIPFIQLGDELKIAFNVTGETGPKLEVSAPFEATGQEELITGECEQRFANEQGRWSCSISIPMTVSAPGQYEIPIRVIDLVGNSEDTLVQIRVVNAGDDQNPDDWQANALDAFQANRHYLSFTSKTLYIPLSLKSRGISYELLDAIPKTSCEPAKDKNGDFLGTAGDLVDGKVTSIGNNNILLSWVLRKGNQYKEFQKVIYTCKVELLTKKGNTLNSYYEQESFNVTVNFHETNTMGATVSEEIQEIVDEYNAESQALLQQKKFISAAAGACGIPSIFKGSGGALSGVAVGMYAVPGLQGAADSVNNAGEKLQKTAEASELITRACSILTCDHELSNLIPNAINKALKGTPDSLARFADHESYADSLDPWNSQVAAMMTGCYPAYLHHKEKSLAIECEYAACLSREVANGFSDAISACEDVKNYAQCRYTMGGIFNALPLANVLKQTQQVVVETISNPVSLFGTAGLAGGCWALQGTAVGKYACLSKAGIEGGLQAWSQFQTIRRQLDQMFASSQTKSACERLIENIEEETTYWKHLDNPDHIDLTLDEGEAGSINFGITQYPLECNQFTGCTATVGTTTANTRTFTFIPQSDDTVILFIDGEIIDTINSDSEDIYNADLEHFNLPSAYVNGDGTASESFKKMLDEALVRTEDYRKFVYEETKNNPEVRQAWERYIGDYAQAQQDVYDTTTPLTDAQRDFDTIDDLRGALIALGQNNDDLAKVKKRMDDTFQNMNPDQRRKVNNLCNCDFLEQENLFGTGFVENRNKEFDQLFGQDISGDLRNLNDDREEVLPSIKSALEVAEKFETDLGIEFNDLETLDEETLQTVVDGHEKDIEKTKDLAKKELENAQEKHKDAQEDLAEAKSNLFLEQYLAENYQNFWQSYRSTLRFARTINTVGPAVTNAIGQLFNSEEVYERWKGRVDEALAQLPGHGYWVGDWEGQYCQSKLGKGQEQLSITQTASSTYVNTARIEGIRIRNGYADSDGFDYVINTFVHNHDQEAQLSFSIILRGDAGTHTLIEKTDLGKGQSLIHTKNTPIRTTLDKKYDEVCISFISNNLQRWFTYSRNNQNFCRRLEIG